MATVVTHAPTINAPPSLWRMSVDCYLGMIAHGLFTDEDRVELLDGLVVTKMTKHPPHTVGKEATRRLLEDIAPSGWCVRSQDPIVLSTSVPEPDAALVRGDFRDFVQQHPNAADVGLVVEVADSSLDRDRGFKLTMYAQAEIPVYWIINLVDMQIEVYTDPTVAGGAAEYLHRQDFQPGDMVPVVVDGTTIGHFRASDCLP